MKTNQSNIRDEVREVLEKHLIVRELNPKRFDALTEQILQLIEERIESELESLLPVGSWTEKDINVHLNALKSKSESEK